MRIIRVTFKTTLFIVEKLIAEFAILAAIFSTIHHGSYIDRAIGGMSTLYNALYSFGHAYAINAGFRDFMGAITAKILSAIAGVVTNIQADPRRVLIAFIITYASYKIIALLLKAIRKKMLGKKTANDGKMEEGETGDAGTYKQLYDDNR